MALEGMTYFDLSLTDRKSAVFHSVPNSFSYYGETVNSKRTDYFLRPAASRGRLDYLFWARTVFHELAHARRQERIALTTIGEAAAGDGVCYVGDYLFARVSEMPAVKSGEVVERVADLPESQIELLRERIATDYQADPWEGEQAERWGARFPGLPITIAEVAGIAGSIRYLEAGRRLRDALWAPAGRLLGIASE